MSSVVTRGLTRRFGSLTAVDHLDLDLPAGGVIGLLGPKDSGRSTLLGMLLGLVRPSSGEAEVLGSSIRTPAHHADRVGALVESPAFVPALSARANLVSLARLRALPTSRVAELIEVVGLTGRENEPVRRFSLGMKQRLGIAAALLPDPELLILDEPTIGLDPAGIVEIRGLLRDLGRSGRTVIVSSHLMAEIEAACDWLVIIRFDELVFSGPITDLMARTRAHIDIRAEHDEDHPRLLAALGEAGWTLRREGDLHASPRRRRVQLSSTAPPRTPASPWRGSSWSRTRSRRSSWRRPASGTASLRPPGQRAGGRWRDLGCDAP